MKRVLLFMGTVIFWCAWPIFLVYFRRSYGRTRVVLVCAGKVLMVRGWISSGKWSLPGGGVHKGESMLDGARREVAEETGIVVVPAQLRQLGDGLFTNYGFRYPYRVFAAQLGHDVTTKLQRHEIAEAWWADPGELSDKNTGSDSLVAIRLAATDGYLLQ